MGWTSYRTGDTFEEAIRNDIAQYPYVVRKVHVHSRQAEDDHMNDAEVYAAVQHPKGHTFGLVVIMFDVMENERRELYYKDMDESMEPFYYNCPTEIINMLSPTENEHAKRWRLKCLQRHPVVSDI